MNIELQQNIFQGGQPVEIELPDSWDVEYHALPGDSCPPLSKQQILEKLRRPYGSKPLFELAQSAREVCIVFDDVTRGTPVRPMAEAVLEELHRAGIRKEQIRFLCATGTHAAQNLWDHTLKLGEEITRNYPVYNHNPYDNTVCIGRTKRGLDVSVNAEFMRCDLRIGLGALTPHTMNAFGGGVKMLFPGLGGIDSIAPNHVLASDYLHARHLGKSAMMGNLAMDCMRTELEEVAAMAGQFFKVDCIYNTRLEPVDLYAGDPVAEYYAAVPAARKLCAVAPARDKDIVIVNANAKATEASIATGLGALGVKKTGGDVVLIDLTRRGQCTHYLYGYFGKFFNGRLVGSMATSQPEVRRYLCWMPHPDLASRAWFGEVDKQVFVDTWAQALELLKASYGEYASVSVIPDGTLCYYQNG